MARHIRRDRPGPVVTLSDVAVGGDIHRIILGGITTPSGLSAREVRSWVIQEHDVLRRCLLSYPYGNEDMCADLVFPSAQADSGHGFIVMECMGYPYFSGSNTMATAAALLDYGRMTLPDGISRFNLEAPSGVVSVEARLVDGGVEEVAVDCDRAYVIQESVALDLPGVGIVEAALVWSGAGFIMLDARPLGIEIGPAGVERMKAVGAEAVAAVGSAFSHAHPEIGVIEPPGFVHFHQGPERTGPGLYTGRGATYGHPATLFNCPTGTGTAAQMALFTARGAMETDASLSITSAAGHTFTGRGLGRAPTRGQSMLATRVAAKPYVLATTTLHLDFSNPVMTDFTALDRILDRRDTG